MSEKPVEVNNSNQDFVNGVLFGIMHGIELTRASYVKDGDEKNKLASLINSSLDSAWGKMFETFTLIRKHNRVPDLPKMVKELVEHPEYKKLKDDERNSLDKMWSLLTNENKRVC